MIQPPRPEYMPAPRQRKPWWVWLLAGCAGCTVLVVVASIILIGMGVSTVKSVIQDVGPVTAASSKQSLGQDFPVYPGSELQLAETQGVVTSFRVIEKLSGKPTGSIFGGAAMYSTSDSPEKVLKHYDAAMKKAGWSKAGAQTTAAPRLFRRRRILPRQPRFQTQVQYKKGNEFGIVQVQESPGTGGAMITLMRGGSELVELNRRRQERSGESPAPAK